MLQMSLRRRRRRKDPLLQGRDVSVSSMASRCELHERREKAARVKVSEGEDPSTLMESVIFPGEFEDSSVAKMT